MGELVEGDDGLVAEDVGIWAKEKHELLCRYVDITRRVRTKFLGTGKAGATYIDLFSGTGKARLRRTGEYIDGSCVAAWKMSVKGGAPFSKVFIADTDADRLLAARTRLERLGAPVTAIKGQAHHTIKSIVSHLNPHALHFAFIDPFNLGAFDFSIMQRLAPMKRIDILVHISKMDLQRNLGFNLTAQQNAFDIFAPGWKANVNLNQSHKGIRKEVFDYWRAEVSKLEIAPSAEMRLITGSRNQHLYWLLLAAKHDLAHDFWKAAIDDGQSSLF